MGFPPGGSERTRGGEVIELEARDVDALLVSWLDELIFRTDTTGLVFPDAAVERADGVSLRARIASSSAAATPARARA